MQWSIDDVPAFVAVCEQLSVTAAAAELQLSKSTVSKALTRLEEGLGVRLLERNSRNLRITHEGEIFLQHAQRILEQVREADATMSGLTSEPQGRLVVALPMAFAREFVAPNLAHFRQRYPQVDLDVVVSSHAVDVIRDQIDLAVTVGALNDSGVVARTLYESQLVWVTSPEYADQHSLDGNELELRSHIQLCEKRYGLTKFPVRVQGSRRFLQLDRGVMHLNDPVSVREAVLNGCGISLLPDQYCKQHLSDGRLVAVYQQVRFEQEAARLSVVYPGRRLLSNKARAFIDFLFGICADM